jgi:hypothetical protein
MPPALFAFVIFQTEPQIYASQDWAAILFTLPSELGWQACNTPPRHRLRWGLTDYLGWLQTTILPTSWVARIRGMGSHDQPVFIFFF